MPVALMGVLALSKYQEYVSIKTERLIEEYLENPSKKDCPYVYTKTGIYTNRWLDRGVYKYSGMIAKICVLQKEVQLGDYEIETDVNQKGEIVLVLKENGKEKIKERIKPRLGKECELIMPSELKQEDNKNWFIPVKIDAPAIICKVDEGK